MMSYLVFCTKAAPGVGVIVAICRPSRMSLHDAPAGFVFT
jgi:hypothetical protein